MNLQPYIDRLKREKEKERKLTAARRERALQAAKQIAKLLKTNYGVEKVFLFGSSLEEEYYHSRSDIDLGVQGLAWDNFLGAYFDVNTMNHEFKVDLIDLAKCDEFLRNKILKEGREI